MICFQQQGCQPLKTSELLGLFFRVLLPLPLSPVVVSSVPAPYTYIAFHQWTLDFQAQVSK